MSKIQPHLYGQTYLASFQIRKFWELNAYLLSPLCQYNTIQYMTIKHIHSFYYINLKNYLFRLCEADIISIHASEILGKDR